MEAWSEVMWSTGHGFKPEPCRNTGGYGGAIRSLCDLTPFLLQWWSDVERVSSQSEACVIGVQLFSHLMHINRSLALTDNALVSSGESLPARTAVRVLSWSTHIWAAQKSIKIMYLVYWTHTSFLSSLNRCSTFPLPLSRFLMNTFHYMCIYDSVSCMLSELSHQNESRTFCFFQTNLIICSHTVCSDITKLEQKCVTIQAWRRPQQQQQHDQSCQTSRNFICTTGYRLKTRQ